MKAAVAALETDVVLLQENWRPPGSESLAAQAAQACDYPWFAELDLVADSPLADLEIVAGPVPEESGAWGLAVLSRRPWTASGTVRLGAARGDVVGERLAQVLVMPLADGGVLRLVNVHLTHRLLHGPRQLRRLIGGLGARSVPTVIAGDFNMCRPQIYLAHPFRPAVRGATWPAHRPVAQLDHLLVSPDVTVTDPAVLGGVGSDHRPVRISVTGG